ncbi:MAG TPA: (2Fe-2S)-binding protein [Polyangiaceae bacterium]|jgi:carbon-monoxide dehydrogenase small subunit|nr:MAG: putative xanthine dehydrogenase subunit E [Deltaproteobacteria bacterium ADurb.Bin207]HNS95507.1 (2Fe-2S)-binding protein [Polyangiaceae bacterium]HNZ23604.1 (2Fe-2S)-binding protein [Polyangiaceae bacterium]HOD22698.1 (2Fe-2S)-binding protein [Polyangiaceae bacterium]HOE47750.1 (2Fe-2S)-binding protein [Polyangiaceae bacterium]
MEYDIEVTVNDVRYKARIPASFTLLQLLRDVLHLTGTKEGCGIGECGACSVVFNGELVNACLVLGVEANGATLRTIEGEAKGEQLSDLQRSFIKHHAAQCGFCTPAMILTAGDLLRRIPTPTDEQIIEGIAGNLCRCTGYEAIVDAIREVARDAKGGAK